MLKKISFFILAFVFASTLFSQNRSIVKGQILDKKTNLPINGANITILKDNTVATSDENGNFKIEIKPDLYNIKVSMLGYSSIILHEIETTTSQPAKLDIFLEEESTILNEAVCKVDAYTRNSESPAALYKFNQFEVLRLAGATMDISKYVKSLPGVSPRVSFGYNMIVRGGASFENKYYLDGIEIPTITHFNVAGTSGGPNGWINTKMLNSAVLHSGAFPSNRPNALSSVLELTQREGRTDRFGGNFTIGPSEWGFMLEGRMGKKSSYIFSARESYAQHALKAIGVPVIPKFSDVSYAQTIHFNDKNTLKIVAMGLYDKYTLNYGADTTESRLYNISFIPEGKQFAYVLGLNYRKIKEDGYSEFVLSRNGFFNEAERNHTTDFNKPNYSYIRFLGKETETKLRYENKIFFEKLALTFGGNFERDNINNTNNSYYIGQNDIYQNSYETQKNINRLGFFTTVSGKLLGEKLDWAASLRTDANNYNKEMQKIFKQLSPRLSASYNVNNLFRINANAGIYYQMPTYGVLLFNKNLEPENIEKFKFIKSNQVALGLEHNNEKGYQIKIESFYKKYSNYIFLTDDNISFANANAAYVAVGMQNANSTGKGQAYGVEFQVRQKFFKTYYWMLQYSYIVSQFADKNGKMVSSAWDNRQFGNLSAGKTFGKGIQLAARFSFAGGAPYTPYDEKLSKDIFIWEAARRGIFDYNNLNTRKLPFFHQLDVRFDKQFNFKKKTLTTYIDVANIYKSKIANIPYFVLQRNKDWSPIKESKDNYKTKLLNSDTGRILYSLGIIFDM